MGTFTVSHVTDEKTAAQKTNAKNSMSIDFLFEKL